MITNPKGHPATLGPPWKKGQSANPGGKARLDPILKKKLRDWTPEMFDRLRQLALGADSDASSIAAIKLMLAYAWGSPENQLSTDDEQPEKTALTVEERRAIARLQLSTEKPPDAVSDNTPKH